MCLNTGEDSVSTVQLQTRSFSVRLTFPERNKTHDEQNESDCFVLMFIDIMIIYDAELL